MWRKIKVETCGYCGLIGEATIDHIIPQGLFGAPLPCDIPTIWACHGCNNLRKSPDDNYLRDIFSTDIRHSHHPVAQANFQKVRRSARGGHSTLAKAVAEAKLIQLYSPGGIYLGRAFQVSVDPKRLARCMTTFARGLYYYHTGHVLTDEPEKMVFDVKFWEDPTRVSDTIQGLLGAGAPHVQVSDGQVFEYVYAIDPENPRVGLWFFNFYRNSIWSVSHANPQPSAEQQQG